MIVPMVPIIPLYFGISPGFGDACSCSRTLAVSIGSVQISAQQAATAEQPKVLYKGMGVLLPPPVMVTAVL
jgi:hypothetical protein